jgi:predicted DCC family thiol-disulfide oxidoreductase YuxK
MNAAPQVRVYTDGNCAFCWWARSLVEPRDLNRRIDFRDFNDPAIAAETPFTTPQLLAEMHVLTNDGRWHAGFWGWLAILRELPRWRWLGRLLSWPPMRWLGPSLYRFLARNRYRIPNWLLRALGAPRPCDSECSVPARP